MQSIQTLFIHSIPIWRGLQSLGALVLRSARSVSSSPEHVRGVMRERPAHSGNECCEFLIAVRSFEEAGNALQRYQLLTEIIHRFVRPGAQRQIPVSQECRRDMLREWRRWAGKERIPPRLPLQAIAAAAIEISTLLVVGPQEPVPA